jgi:hypothetical protein
MSRSNKVLIFSLASLACIVLLIFVAWVLHEPEIALGRSSSEPLTDSEAVELSREALRRSGHEAGSLAPERFQRDNTNYYARNTITPYSGYVLWASTGASSEAFAVHMEQRGTQVFCVVSMPK